jgi:PadR family transcriptional regulator, regulatory protein AphA
MRSFIQNKYLTQPQQARLESAMSLKHLVLAVLSRQPATGYEITKTFDAIVGSFWRASHQQVYRELSALSKIGLATFSKVCQIERPDKKVYTITPAGVEELLQWLTSLTQERPLKDDLLIKVWAGELLGPEALRREIARLRVSHEAELDRYRAIEREHFSSPPNDAFEVLQYVALKRGICSEQSWLAWSKEAETLLQTLNGSEI